MTLASGEVVVGRRGTEKRDLAQGWIPLQKQDRWLLRLLERGPERTLFRGREMALLRTLAREPVRQQGREPLRYEGRVRFRVQGQRRNRVLLGFEYRRPVRGPSIGPERGHERPLYPVPWRRLLRVPEQSPLKGQALPQLSGRRLRRRSDRAISDQR